MSCGGSDRFVVTPSRPAAASDRFVLEGLVLGVSRSKELFTEAKKQSVLSLQCALVCVFGHVGGS